MKGNQLSAVTNRWLTFKNIRDAALEQNFSLVKIGYNRNDAILAAKAEKDPARQAFVEWAVDFIRTNTQHRKITKQAVFEAWHKHGGQTCARSYFTATQGTPLNMEKLRMQAFPLGQGRPAAAASESEDDCGPGGSGAEYDTDGGQWLKDDASFDAGVIGSAGNGSASAGAVAAPTASTAIVSGETAPAAAERKEAEVNDSSFPASPPLTTPGSRLLCQDVPEKRGFTLREILSLVVFTMRSPSCPFQLPSRYLGRSKASLLKDGDLIAVYERAYGFQTGCLGPNGSCQPAFHFRESFLDRPSREASAEAQILVAEATGVVRHLDWSKDRIAIDAIFQSALRRILDGAGRGPLSPEKEGGLMCGRTLPSHGRWPHSRYTVASPWASLWTRWRGPARGRIHSFTTLKGKRQHPAINQKRGAVPPPPPSLTVAVSSRCL